MKIEEVEKGTIFLTGVGSRAYGINNPDSDYDQAGVMIPPSRYFFGGDKFEQFTDFPDQDKVIYDVRKAVNLIMDNNPNMLDLLFSPTRCILILKKEWEIMMDNRDKFLSKKCRHTYSGYAFAQLRRIETHRKFLLDPPKVKPERVNYGLPAVSIFPTAQLKAIAYSALGDFIVDGEKDKLLGELDDVYSNYLMPIFNRYIKPESRALSMEYLQVGVKSQAATLTSLGPSYIKDEYYDMASKELVFYNDNTLWTQYQAWLKQRNKARAELEEKFGYDTKHAAHLVRLLRMCLEILETGEVFVDRTSIDAEELKDIRRGAWSFPQLKEYASKMDEKAGELYETSTLQRSPDSVTIKALLEDVCEKYTLKESLKG
jgi:uncharacterized protein